MKLYFEELKNKKVNTLYYIYKSEEDAKNDEIDPLYIFSDKFKADLAKENGYYVDVITDKDCLALYEYDESLSKKRINEDLTSQNDWTIFAEEENSSWSEDTVKQFIYSLHPESNEMIKKVSGTPYNITIYLNDGEDIKSMSDFYKDVFTRGGLKASIDFDTRFNVILISLPTKELSIIAYVDYVNKLYNILDNYELKLDLYKALTSGHWN